MVAMSRQRSHSARVSPPSSPSHRSSVASDRHEPRRAATTNVGTSNRVSILLSERQVNKINKKIANIRHNSLAGASASATDLLERDASSAHSRPASFLSTSYLDPSVLTVSNSGVTKSPDINETVGMYPVHIQEYAVIEDLLSVLVGISGQFITIIYPKGFGDDDERMEDIGSDTDGYDDWDNIRYTVDQTLDPSLGHLVERLLPLATYYMSIDAFVDQHSRYEYGTVNHALAAAMGSILKEYMTFIAQLEYQFQTSNTFGLQKMWFYVQDTMQQMRILHQLATSIRQLQTRNQLDADVSVDIDAVLEGLKAADEQGEIRISEQEKGGAILNILTERLIALSGDRKCKKIYSFLLSRASVPYFDILHQWIYRGEIVDPYNEFMVLEKQNVKKENLKEDFNDAYWEMRYTVREKLVPTFLEPLKAKILLAGKYLNVVRECGINIAKPEDMARAVLENSVTDDQASNDLAILPARNEIWSAVDGGRFVKNLEIAYKYANHTLLNLLLKDQQLIGRLGSLKHYFFLDQSDFLTSFLDLAKDELRLPAKEISLTRLQSLMDLVLRNPSSVAAYDPFKDDLRVCMSPLKLVDELLRIINVTSLDNMGASRDTKWTDTNGFADASSSALLERSQSLAGSVLGSSSVTGSSSRGVLSGYDALTLDYTVAFPLSLVISRKALTKYQLIFRHLLYLKHVENLLCETWMDQKDKIWKRWSKNPEINAWKFRIFSLRHRMLMFVQQFAYYVTNEVLEPNWCRLAANLKKVTTVDQVLQYHSDFLDTCLKECMLTNAKSLKVYNKLMNSCILFATHAERFRGLLERQEEHWAPDMFGLPQGGFSDPNLAASFESASKSLTKIEDTFSYHITLLIDVLSFYSATETVQFLCLVVRLDYNLYHKSQTATKK